MYQPFVEAVPLSRDGFSVFSRLRQGDEGMPEQDAASVAERAALGTEPETVAVPEGAPVAEPTVVQPVAETPQLDLSTRDGIRKAAEQYPELASWREEGYHAGRQKGESDFSKRLREEQGSEEFARREAQHWAEKYGVQLDEADIKALPVRTRLAQEKARLDQMRSIASEAMGMAASEEEASFLKALIDNAEGSADEMQKVATAAISAVSNRSAKTALDALPDEDIKSHPRLNAFIEAEVTRRQEEEARAQAAEAARLDAPPDAPPGTISAGTMTLDRFRAMPPDSRAAFLKTASQEVKDALWAAEGAAMVGR